MNRLLRRPEVEKMTGLSRSKIYLMVAADEFPKPVNLGPRAVAWVQREVEAWMDDRIADRDTAA
jgi:prophage regulatory protein